MDASDLFFIENETGNLSVLKKIFKVSLAALSQMFLIQTDTSQPALSKGFLKIICGPLYP